MNDLVSLQHLGMLRPGERLHVVGIGLVSFEHGPLNFDTTSISLWADAPACWEQLAGSCPETWEMPDQHNSKRPRICGATE